MTPSTDDRLVIHELISLHGHLADDRRPDDLDQVFTSDVVFDLVDFGAGPDAHGGQALTLVGHSRAMSFDTELYTRDRPIIDETQTSWLERDGEYSWEREDWRFGGMIVHVDPYTFVAGREDPLGIHFEDEDEDELPDWLGEVRWRVNVSGRAPDDDFFDWFHDLAASARGVIWNPYRTGDEQLEHADAHPPGLVARRMMYATRPSHCDHDDRTTDMVRVADPAAVWRAVCDNVYGAELATAVAAGLRLSPEAAQYVALAAEGDGPLWFSVFGDPIRGTVDPRALTVLTGGAALPGELRDCRELRNELVDFWERVIALDPRLDPARLTGELRRPRMA